MPGMGGWGQQSGLNKSSGRSKKIFPVSVSSTVASLGWCSPQSGRRSDSGEKFSLERKQLVYSQPPRGQGEVDHGGGRHQLSPLSHFVPTPPSVYTMDYRDTPHPTTTTTSTTAAPPVRRPEVVSKAGQVITGSMLT